MAAKPFGSEYVSTVVDNINRYPSINLSGVDDERGKLVDAVAYELNGFTVNGPWGRKARRSDGTNKNGDGLTYKHPNGRFQIIDILIGYDTPHEPRSDYATWQDHGDFAMGENGYWAPAVAPPAKEPDPSGVVNGILHDPKTYFFHLINRREGSLANDWESVLKDLQNRGMSVNPKPGQRPDCSMKFHAITLMVADNGKGAPRGRIWLPTEQSVTDSAGNIWFTREVQVIARDAADHIWHWHELGGAPFVALNCTGEGGNGGNGGEGGNGGGEDQLTREEVQQMIDDALRPYIKKGDNISLKTQPWDGQPGKIVCGDRNEGNHLIANRDGVGAWEQLTVDRQD